MADCSRQRAVHKNGNTCTKSTDSYHLQACYVIFPLTPATSCLMLQQRSQSTNSVLHVKEPHGTNLLLDAALSIALMRPCVLDNIRVPNYLQISKQQWSLLANFQAAIQQRIHGESGPTKSVTAPTLLVIHSMICHSKKRHRPHTACCISG